MSVRRCARPNRDDDGGVAMSRPGRLVGGLAATSRNPIAPRSNCRRSHLSQAGGRPVAPDCSLRQKLVCSNFRFAAASGEFVRGPRSRSALQPDSRSSNLVRAVENPVGSPEIYFGLLRSCSHRKYCLPKLPVQTCRPPSVRQCLIRSTATAGYVHAHGLNRSQRKSDITLTARHLALEGWCFASKGPRVGKFSLSITHYKARRA